MGNESSSSKFKESGIVVVTKPDEDSALKDTSVELDFCPTFKPLLSSSLNIPETRPLLSELVKQIDSKSCLKLCIHLQNHLEQCSEAVKFDQTALISRIKEVDRVSSVVVQHLIERQRIVTKQAEDTRKVEEISTTLSSLQKRLDRTITMANELNSLLPDNLKLEKLKL